MGKSYEEAVSSTEHDYGEYISQINFVEEAIKQTGPKTVYKAALELLKEEYEGELKGGRSRKKIKQKAKQAAHPRFKGPYNFIPKFSGRSGSERLVKEAIEKGYLQSIKLSVPWHPAIYTDENKLTTFPHQHTSAVLYTSRNIYEFYTAEYLEKERYHENIDGANKPEDLFAYESILKTGFIPPGNRNVDVDRESHLTDREAIFLSADDYADKWEDIIFEVEAPTNNLGFLGPEGDTIWSIEGWFRKYGKPENRINRTQIIFANPQGEKGRPHLPLKFVNGVHDPRYSTKKYFYPLEKYVKRLYQDMPGKIPEPKEWNLQQPKKINSTYSFRRSNKGSKIEHEKIKEEAKVITKFKEELVPKKGKSLVNTAEIIGQKLDKNKEGEEIYKGSKLKEFNAEIYRLNEGINAFLNSDNRVEEASLISLYEQNYFRKMAVKAKELWRDLDIEQARLHEMAEGKREMNPEEVIEASKKLLEDFQTKLILVEINRKTPFLILRENSNYQLSNSRIKGGNTESIVEEIMDNLS